MKLYHYSRDLFQQLMSRRASGLADTVEIAKAEKSRQRGGFPKSYVDHISFFFDPIPAALLPRLFPKDHRAWAKGMELYEYVVDVDSLSPGFIYHVVESKRLMDFLDSFSIEHNWTTDDPAILDLWFKESLKKQKEWGEFGSGLNDLKQQIKLNGGHIEDDYRKATSREDFKYNKYKYAASVPHLMLYPETGIVEISSINKVTMGSDRRIIISKGSPGSLKW